MDGTCSWGRWSIRSSDAANNFTRGAVRPDFARSSEVTPEFVVGFARQAIEMTLIISLPMLGIGMAVGIFVSVLQAATQIQEMTLTMVPKIVAIFLALLIAFPWIMDKMMSYTTNLFLNLPNYIR